MLMCWKTFFYLFRSLRSALFSHLFIWLRSNVSYLWFFFFSFFSFSMNILWFYGALSTLVFVDCLDDKRRQWRAASQFVSRHWHFCATLSSYFFLSFFFVFFDCKQQITWVEWAHKSDCAYSSSFASRALFLFRSFILFLSHARAPSISRLCRSIVCL